MEPKIRLKGFCGEWEETTFDKSVTINSGMDYKHLAEGNIPVYGTGGYMLSVNESLSEVDAIGIGRKGTIDKPQLLKAPFWTVDTLFFMTPKNCNDLNFLYALSQKINWRKYDESTGVPSLSKVNIGKIEFARPNKNEQQAIASYFQQLDSLIQSTTKKIESLKQVKAASLQSMFPQEGETTPRVRFKGFDGEWEKVAVGNLGSWSKGRLLSKSDLVDDGKNPCVHYGELFVNYGEVITKVVSATNIETGCLSESGDILFPDSDVTPTGLARCSAIMLDGVILGGGINILRIRKNNYAPFVSYSINQEKEQIITRVTGTTVRHINASALSEVVIKLPSDKVEQTAIADYFTNLDSQITLQTQRLEKLKQIKSACLDNMFV